MCWVIELRLHLLLQIAELMIVVAFTCLLEEIEELVVVECFV